MRESELQSKCLAWVKEAYPDVVVANIHGGGWAVKGFPDIICCIQGKFVAFELKVAGNAQSAAQRIWQMRIIRAGGSVYVPYTLEEFQKAVINEYEIGKPV